MKKERDCKPQTSLFLLLLFPLLENFKASWCHVLWECFLIRGCWDHTLEIISWSETAPKHLVIFWYLARGSSQGQSRPPPGLYSLWEHSCDCWLRCSVVCGCFLTTRAKPSSCGRDCMSCKSKTFTLWPLQKTSEPFIKDSSEVLVPVLLSLAVWPWAFS